MERTHQTAVQMELNLTTTTPTKATIDREKTRRRSPQTKPISARKKQNKFGKKN